MERGAASQAVHARVVTASLGRRRTLLTGKAELRHGGGDQVVRRPLLMRRKTWIFDGGFEPGRHGRHRARDFAR